MSIGIYLKSTFGKSSKAHLAGGVSHQEDIDYLKNEDPRDEKWRERQIKRNRRFIKEANERARKQSNLGNWSIGIAILICIALVLIGIYS